MSDPLETDALETGIAPDQMQVGVALKSARERRNMTVEDVCTHLRISPHQVKALESDDFAALPEAMITRGFIRNYARLLEIDAEPLLQAYRAFMPVVVPRALTLKSENILITGKDKRPWLKYIVASLFIALFLGVWQFYMDYTPKPSVQQAVLPAENTDGHADTNAGASQETVSDNIVTESLPVAALPAAERVQTEEAQAALAPAEVTSGTSASANGAATTTTTNTNQPLTNDVKTAAKTTAKLKLSFSQTSWVNVTDRNKKMIFDKIMPAGSEDTVEGEPPLEVVVGNAPGSRLVFNDKLVDLVPYTKSNVARVTLE